MIERQIRIGDAGLYAMTHAPETEPKAAIVFCNPLFEERKSAHRAVVEAAQLFCSLGFYCVRFDYRGCGDSPGSFEDFSVPDWLADIRNAIAFTTRQAQVKTVGLLGLRLGASLAMLQAADNPAISFVILWEPVVDGMDHLRQELRKKLIQEMVTFGRSDETRASLLSKLESGASVDFDGYPLSARLYRDLGAVRLPQAARSFDGRCLMVHVTHADHESVSASSMELDLKGSRCRMEFCVVQGQPFWNLIGYVDCGRLLLQTSEWLVRACGRQGMSET